MTSLSAAGLLIGQRRLGGRGFVADGDVGGALAFTRVVEVAGLGCVQTWVTGFPHLRAGAAPGQRRV